MLRLTRIAATHLTQTIKLEGKLLRPWVDEVRKTCASCTDPDARTRPAGPAFHQLVVAGHLGAGPDLVLVAEDVRIRQDPAAPGLDESSIVVDEIIDRHGAPLSYAGDRTAKKRLSCQGRLSHKMLSGSSR